MLFLALPAMLLTLWALSGLWGDDEDEPEAESGAETDEIRLTDGDDVFFGTFGSDTIFAGAGDDFVSGTPESPQFPGDDYDGPIDRDDTIYLGAGNDIFDHYEEGNDLVRGGSGDDVLIHNGAYSFVTLYGDLGNDLIDTTDPESRYNSGSLVGDTLYGGDGDDELRADVTDELYGGAGMDSYFIDLSDCGDEGLDATIHDYEAGEAIAVRLAYAEEPGPRMVTPRLTEDGQAVILPVGVPDDVSYGYIVLEGFTDVTPIEVTVLSREEQPPEFACD